MYFPYANEGYRMGVALREVSQSKDLVITLANDLGDPVAIYYSQKQESPEWVIYRILTPEEIAKLPAPAAIRRLSHA